MIAEKIGIMVHWECSLEVELNGRKREWLTTFSCPGLLSSDITKCREETIYNFMSESECPLPDWLCSYIFGYSCVDVSTLNNVSGPWRDQCLSDGIDATGKTWRGNLDVVKKTRPCMVMMEM